MTTNGQLLDLYVKSLRAAGLSLIRTSWHSTDPTIFREMSGGHGDYDRFFSGIQSAADAGLKISFNRVLHKGHTDDLSKQLDFIERHDYRLKLYTLMWTPQSANTYEQFYQDWRPIVRSSVLPRTIRVTREKKRIGRQRLRFQLSGGGLVEVKLGDNLDRTADPCRSCLYKDKCEEGFGDYIRVDPRLHLYFCYMRRDLGFSLLDYLEKPITLKERLHRVVGDKAIESILTTAPLRLTVTPYCNFNCRSPGADKGWCMEEPGEYTYPPIQPTLLRRK